MPGCEAQTFTGVTPHQFTCIAQKAQEESGLALSGDSGTVSAQGISVSWTFDPLSLTLTIQCTDKPMFVPCGMLSSKIRDIVDSCLGY